MQYSLRSIWLLNDYKLSCYLKVCMFVVAYVDKHFTLTAMAFTERFLGQSYKRVPDTSKVNIPWSFSLRFRTAKPSGTLVETTFSSSSSVLKVGFL